MYDDHVGDKRARLLASKTKWSDMDYVTATQPIINVDSEKCNQNNNNKWNLHSTSKNQENVQESVEYAAYLDDKTTLNTVKNFLSTYPERPPLTSAWNSLSSGISGHSGPPSAMDVLTLWQDDPEELLLDLGFGAEEPDITVKIPARFINHQSQARGINIQVFLEAQQSRIDIENPDVKNRFRQTEVLHQVTTAFSSLVGGNNPIAQRSVESQLSEEARVRRKRVGMLFKNASKKSLSQLAKFRNQQSLSSSLASQSSRPELPGDLSLDKRIPLKRPSLSPLVEEQTLVTEGSESTDTTTLPQVKSSSLRGGRELKDVTSAITFAKGGTVGPAESFELEEIQSFDEGSIGGTWTSTPDQTGNKQTCLSRVRTNSCQSDSSGFLEEPFVPAYPNPGPELMKVLNAMSGDSTEGLQKSMDLQETVVHSPYSQDSDKLLTQTESSVADSTGHTDIDIGMIRSTEGITKRHIQDINRNDCLVNTAVVQSDIIGYSVEESIMLLKDSLGLHDYIPNTVQNTKLQIGTSGTDEYGTSTIQSTTLQKDLPVLHDHCARFGDSIKLQKNSLNSSHDVVVGRNSHIEMQDSDVSAFKIDSWSTDSKAGIVNKVPSSTEGYYGRSVSVQMSSSLASQSSLRGSISHSSSTQHNPTIEVQLKREFREQSGSDMANIADNVRSTCIHNIKENTLPNPWRSQESSKGPQSTSLDKSRSYEEDTRWQIALWTASQSCGCCQHKWRCCCQNMNTEKQDCCSTEQLDPASSLPYSIEELTGMKRCMWKFQRMLTDIEERLEEEQETVNSSFSDEHREEMQDILKLRTAVKKESEMLEQHLNDLVQAYDDNIKVKMNRLLDEQSHLCTQLKILPQPAHISKKSVGIQCSLLTDRHELRLTTQLTDDTRLIHNTKWSPGGKTDTQNVIGFIKSLKDGSVNRDSLE